MARSSGPDKAIVKESDNNSNSSSVSGCDSNDSMSKKMIPALLKKMPMTTFVPGLLDDLIHISSNGKMRKAPQLAELKQKKRGNLLFFSSNIYNN